MDKNQVTLEMFVISLLIGIGTPLFALLGYHQGRAALEEIQFDPSSVISPQESQALLQAKTQAILGSPEGISQGKELFQSMCSSCHGTQADGLGPAAGALNPPPKNFLDPKAVYKLGTQPEELFAALTQGVPGTGMAGFEAGITFEDRWALVNYLGSLSGISGRFNKISLQRASELAQADLAHK